MRSRYSAAHIVHFADQFAAMGAEPRLRIMRLLLSAHPEGLVVGEIQEELDVPGSTLSHHLEKLKNEGLVVVRRDRQFLWYSAKDDALRELLAFLYEECCSRSKAVKAGSLIQLNLQMRRHARPKETS